MKIKTTLLLLLSLLGLPLCAQVMEYQTVTVIESIIPNGIGRSRMISTEAERDYKEFTSERSEEDNSRNNTMRLNNVCIELDRLISQEQHI